MDIKVTRNHWHECRIGGADLLKKVHWKSRRK